MEWNDKVKRYTNPNQRGKLWRVVGKRIRVKSYFTGRETTHYRVIFFDDSFLGVCPECGHKNEDVYFYVSHSIHEYFCKCKNRFYWYVNE